MSILSDSAALRPVPSTAGDDAPVTVLWTLMLAARLVAMDFDRLTAAHVPWSTNTGCGVMLLARSPEPVPIGAVAARCGLRESTVTGILDKLTDQGTVARIPDPTDRRRCSVTLTEAGEVRLRALMPLLERGSQQMKSPLTHDEQGQLDALLTKLVRARVPEAF